MSLGIDGKLQFIDLGLHRRQGLEQSPWQVLAAQGQLDARGHLVGVLQLDAIEVQVQAELFSLRQGAVDSEDGASVGESSVLFFSDARKMKKSSRASEQCRIVAPLPVSSS